MELPDRYDKLLRLLPRYLSGFIWLLAIAAVASLSITPANFESWLASRSDALGELRVPDLAVGFLVVIFGVLLPLAVSVIIGPASLGLATLMLRKWYSHRKPTTATPAQYVVAVRRMERLLGAGTVRESGVYVLHAYLHQIGSVLFDDLDVERRDNFMKANCALPVGIIGAATVYFVMGQNAIAFGVAFVFGILLFAGTVHNAARGAKAWEEEVVLAFLLATTSMDDKPKPMNDAAFSETAP